MNKENKISQTRAFGTVRGTQILSIVLSVVFSLFLVVIVVYAASTIGNNVSVGGTLTVTSTSTFNGGVVLGDAATDKVSIIGQLDTGIVLAATTTTYGLDFNGATLTNDIRLDAGETISNSGDTIAISAATTTFDGDVVLGDAATDRVSFVGVLDTALVMGATTTTYGLDLNSATLTTDIRLSNGETIDNATDGRVDVTGDVTVSGNLGVGTTTPGVALDVASTTATSTIRAGSSGQVGCIALWSSTESAYVYLIASNAGIATTTAAACGL